MLSGHKKHPPISMFTIKTDTDIKKKSIGNHFPYFLYDIFF